MANSENNVDNGWASPEKFCSYKDLFSSLASSISVGKERSDKDVLKTHAISWLKSVETSNHSLTQFDAESENQKAQHFLLWAESHSQLKVVAADIPKGILPQGFTGRLHDIKVFARGPDDAIYDADAALRRKVARGNCLLELRSPDGTISHSCVVYAMKKFTGGLGDDDDRERGDNMTWKLYFTKTLDDARQIVCTNKANGEAAHFSACVIEGTTYLCAGSKNVHMLFRNRADVSLYDSKSQRFKIAIEIAYSFLDVLESMPNETRHRFLEFLCVARVTGVAEILNPNHPHIEDLSHLAKPLMTFIAWTSNELQPDSDNHCFTTMPPNVSIEIARSFGLHTIDYDMIIPDKLDERMLKIRQKHGEEGEVLVFLDDDQNVIGLLKKKSVWYIIVRAIREKVKSMAVRFKKSPPSVTLDVEISKVEKRIDDIQKWLDLDKKCIDSWKALASHFMSWSYERLNRSVITDVDLNDRFPIYWKQFLDDTETSDRIQATVCS